MNFSKILTWIGTFLSWTSAVEFRIGYDQDNGSSDLTQV